MATIVTHMQLIMYVRVETESGNQGHLGHILSRSSGLTQLIKYIRILYWIMCVNNGVWS